VFTWAKIALLVLKIADAIMTFVGNQKQFQAGTDAEIAKVSTSILSKTAAGKAVLEKINALSDSDVDAQLRGLEPR
jgi:hypothetical protein